MQVGVCNCIDMLVDGTDTYKHCIHTKDRCKRKVGKVKYSVLEKYWQENTGRWSDKIVSFFQVEYRKKKYFKKMHVGSGNFWNSFTSCSFILEFSVISPMILVITQSPKKLENVLCHNISVQNQTKTDYARFCFFIRLQSVPKVVQSFYDCTNFEWP